jgi:hypothetical protein
MIRIGEQIEYELSGVPFSGPGFAGFCMGLECPPYGPRIVHETCEKRALLARFSHICLLCGEHVFGTFKSVRFMCVFCAFSVRSKCA